MAYPARVKSNGTIGNEEKSPINIADVTIGNEEKSPIHIADVIEKMGANRVDMKLSKRSGVKSRKLRMVG